MPVDAVIQTTVDLIKIDVEGHEYRAVIGAMETIRRSRPVIIGEFSPVALESNSRVAPVSYLDLLRLRISLLGQSDSNTDEAILESVRGVHHVGILAEPLLRPASLLTTY
jgi:hypothetical protein